MPYLHKKASLEQFYFYLAGLILEAPGCSTSKKAASSPATSVLQLTIDSVRKTYAPDKRTALFDVTANGPVVSGETNVPEAKTALLQIFQKENATYVDSIRTLPDTSLNGNNFAVVSISVANLRAKPGHPNEMVTQATLGTPLKVLKRERGWCMVQTPDKYIAWTENGGIKLMNTTRSAQWQAAEKAIYIKPYGFAYTAESTDSQTVSDLVYGDVMVFRKEHNGFFETSFPDGRVAYIPATEII